MDTDEDSKQFETQEKTSGGAYGRDVCRDFLKNRCSRGSRCRFYHPQNIGRQYEGNSAPGGSKYIFCVDFQGGGCQREDCRFVHAGRDDVDRYTQTGEVTLNLARAIVAVHNDDRINGIPICKDFQRNTCSRGAYCRYWHVNIQEEREKRHRQFHGIAAIAELPDSHA